MPKDPGRGRGRASAATPVHRLNFVGAMGTTRRSEGARRTVGLRPASPRNLGKRSEPAAAENRRENRPVRKAASRTAQVPMEMNAAGLSILICQRCHDRDRDRKVDQPGQATAQQAAGRSQKIIAHVASAQKLGCKTITRGPFSMRAPSSKRPPGRSSDSRVNLHPRLPTISRSGIKQVSSPVTAAGPRRIHTVFPILRADHKPLDTRIAAADPSRLVHSSQPSRGDGRLSQVLPCQKQGRWDHD